MMAEQSKALAHVREVFAGFDPNWFYTFLGAMLLLAVLVNLYVKNYASTRR